MPAYPNAIMFLDFFTVIFYIVWGQSLPQMLSSCCGHNSKHHDGPSSLLARALPRSVFMTLVGCGCVIGVVPLPSLTSQSAALGFVLLTYPEPDLWSFIHKGWTIDGYFWGFGSLNFNECGIIVFCSHI